MVHFSYLQSNELRLDEPDYELTLVGKRKQEASLNILEIWQEWQVKTVPD